MVTINKTCTGQDYSQTLFFAIFYGDTRMAEIKSALEIALERAEKIGKLSKEELAAQEWSEKGKKIAADFLSGRIDDLKTALSDVPGEMLVTVIDSVMDILVRNIVLPRDPDQWDGIRKAMHGIVDIKGSMAMQVMPGIEDLLKQYEQTRNQYLEQFQARMEQVTAGGAGMGNAAGADINAIAAMQQEWERISAEINQQFEHQLDQMKTYLRQI
jgi:hypothetical protein